MVGIVLTESLRPELECVLPPERVSVVANGIVAPSIDDRLPSDGTVHVLFLSSLFRWKGPLVFIDAFARARKNCPFLCATVAGDWPSELLPIVRLARERGCAYILFDSDADTTELLPAFDW